MAGGDMNHLREFSRGMIVLMVLMLSASFAMAQSSLISGTATDPAGNALAGVTITLTNLASGTSRNISTKGDGTFQISQVASGTYKLRAEAKGFKALVIEDVSVLVNTPLTLSLEFKELGAVNEAVTVTGGETAVNTSDATIGNTFNQAQVRDLPLASRNVVGLLSLQPGVTPGGYVNGGRSDQSNITLDGIDVNEQQTGQAYFSVTALNSGLTPGVPRHHHQPECDQGRSSGAQIRSSQSPGRMTFTDHSMNIIATP
jgi:hypothetical protein